MKKYIALIVGLCNNTWKIKKEFTLKKIAYLLLALFVSGCYTSTLDLPKKYDIYLDNVAEGDVLGYTKFLTKQSYYESHKVLSISNNNSELTYTSKLAPEMVYQKTKDYFGDNYHIKLNSNILKIRKINEDS